MDFTLKLWVLIVVIGTLNYLSRLSFIALFARRSVPEPLLRSLRYVPAAMLTALVLPMIVDLPVESAATAAPKIVAALIAGFVAFATQGMLRTLAAGMLTLWALQALARHIG